MTLINNGNLVRGRTLPSSSPKRILFYGACHATVLAKIFENFCTDLSYSFDRMTNYEMIRRNIPFPYESVAEWDAIVFCPIFKHAGYETSRLIDACLKNNVKYVCYPYLEWRGYFPYITEDYFLNMRFWHYQNSVSLARTSSDFESYRVKFDKEFKEGNYIFENLESTSETLRKNEILGECNVTISDFIAKEFRNKRLFLIPSHPTQALYKEVVNRLNCHLKLPIDSSYLHSAAEPQDGVKVPIHPAVSDRLELYFQDADFQNNTSSFGNRNIPWSDYLRLAYGFGKNSAIWQATSHTAVKRVLGKTDMLGEDDFIKVPKGTIFQARAGSSIDPFHLDIDITWSEPELRHRIMHWGSVYIYKEHWQETT